MSYHEGSIVRVQLYDGRVVEAEVKAVLDSVTGRNLRIKFGDFVNIVDASQVVEVVRNSSHLNTRWSASS